MKHRIALYLLFVAALCMGCGNALTKRELMALEARINEVPDSVLAVLTATDMPFWGEPRALYALLTVEAQDKSYIDVADDSLICVATRCYNRHGSPLHRLQAFYYQGRVYTNAGLRHEAMAAFTRALDFVDEVDAPYPVGLLYAQLGVLYGNDYDHSSGIAYMKEALKYYELAGKKHLQNFAKLDLGQFYLNMEDSKQAEALFKEALLWAETHNDLVVMYGAINQLLRLYDATANLIDLETLLNKYPIETVLQNATTYGIIAHHYARKGEEESAMTTLSRAWEISATAQDTAMLWHKSYQLNKTFRHTEAALRDYEYLFALQDSVVRITLQQPLIASQRDHYQTQLELTSSRLLNYRYLAGISVLILLIAAIILYIYIRNRLRHKQEELNGYIELADELRHTLYHKEESIVSNEAAMERIRQELQLSHAQLEELRTQLHTNDDAMQAQIAELFGGQFQLLNRLSETYYQWENREQDTVKDKIFAQVKTEIEGLRKGDTLAELESIVNKHLDNVMARLRAEIPYLKETDYTYLIYFYARFSGKAISLFTGTKRDTIYKIKERLCHKIKSSDAPSKEFFLSQLP